MRGFKSIEVDIAKLRDYCLSDDHPRGRHKARVLRSRLGLVAGDAELLRQALLDAAGARRDELQPTDRDAHGQRYVLDFALTTAAGTAMVRSARIVLANQDVLRFVSCCML